MGTDPHAQSAADATFLDGGAVLVPHLEADGCFAQGTDADASPADTGVHPWVARRTIDLRQPHVNLMAGHRRERLSGADLNAFVAKDAGLFLGFDIGRVDLAATVAGVEEDATRRAHLAAQPAADTGRHEVGIVFSAPGGRR